MKKCGYTEGHTHLFEPLLNKCRQGFVADALGDLPIVVVDWVGLRGPLLYFASIGSASKIIFPLKWISEAGNFWLDYLLLATSQESGNRRPTSRSTAKTLVLPSFETVHTCFRFSQLFWMLKFPLVSPVPPVPLKVGPQLLGVLRAGHPGERVSFLLDGEKPPSADRYP